MDPQSIEIVHRKPELEGFNHKQIQGLPRDPAYATWSASLLSLPSLPAMCYTNTGNWAFTATWVTKVESV